MAGKKRRGKMVGMHRGVFLDGVFLAGRWNSLCRNFKGGGGGCECGRRCKIATVKLAR